MLKKTLEKTTALDLEFWYNIGPGLSMKYSSQEDFNALTHKLEQVYDLGVRNFGLLFDDIPMELQHPEDEDVFDDLPHAHAHVANKLFGHLKDYLVGEHSGVTYSDVATALGMTEGAVKMAAHRMRQRYRELLRLEIVQTVSGPGDVDDEIRSLFAIFAG